MNRWFYILTLALIFMSTYAQSKTVTGKVTDKATNEAVIGVSVVVAGTYVGTVTDYDGKFQINIPEDKNKLSFSYIGYDTQEIEVGSATYMDVHISAATINVDEVVVTALGIKREAKSLAYSRQNVDAESIAENKTSDFATSLAGKVAGMQVSPGATNTSSSSITLRGYSSITGNNQPLIVIDGVPVDSSSGNDGVTAGGGGLDYGSATGDLNSEDIENIEVLKGPNAAALYGSRAANGVLLITTKRASGEDRFKLSIASNTTIQTVAQWPDYQNVYGGGHVFSLDSNSAITDSDDVLRLADMTMFTTSWGAPMIGQTVYNNNGDVVAYIPQENNVKDAYKTAVMLTNTATLEGGNERNSYRFSYTNTYSDSPVEKMNIVNSNNFNLRVFNTLVDGLTLDTRLMYLNDKVTNRQYATGSNKNPAYQYVFMMRNSSLDDMTDYKDADGKEQGGYSEFSNPFWIINENHNEDIKNKINAVANLRYEINDDISATLKYGTEIQHIDGFEFENIGGSKDTNGYYSTLNRYSKNYTLEGLLSYNKKIDWFEIGVNAGMSRYDNLYEKRTMKTNALLMADWMNIANTTEKYINNETNWHKRINSIYASANFGFNSIAYIDVTARNDWSSTLSPDNNSYFYPSFGGSVVLTELFDLPNKISFAKLRASYAIVGNDTEPYRLTNYYYVNGMYNNYPYASEGTLYADENLLPETTSSFEAGLDLRLFQGRLNFDLTYYKSSTKDQILQTTLPYASGYVSRMFNAGEVQNNGVEFSVNATPIRTTNFNWNTTVNFAKNNSLVVSLIDGVDQFKLQQWNTVSVYAEVGQPFGVIRGTGYARDENGNIMVKANGTHINKENEYLGNATPDWAGSFMNSFKYKSFDMSFLIDASMGGILYSASYKKGCTKGIYNATLEGRDDYYRESIIYGRNASENQSGILIDGVFANGEQNDVYISPQTYFTGGGYGIVDALSVFDASYIKLRQLSVGYTLPSRILANKSLSSFRVSFTAQNLWTIYQNTPKGIDPESSVNAGNGRGIEAGTLPPMRYFGLDVRFSF